ncbi:MAG TPA: hypothetical protein PKM65_16540 [Spirochaetota bacterium]|nr:hypothetical protein [Spirochaetota bacterium]HNT11735.1 hypothetical protein [Spirochaetota bacterium]HNV47201.1 hypothetical protein [Spirochaetota bacterium]HOS40764.1 hypothetical protein [Spirochaetota bacterium]HPU90115.1 hypothetical protein [Spirochaetota bacterium]
MFYLLLRMIHDDLSEGRISQDEYLRAIERLARIHGIRKNGIR